MTVYSSIKIISSLFIYTPDNHKLFDRWRIMKVEGGKMYGDCEDFSLTVLWYLCNRNFFTFFWKVFVTHQYRIYHVKTHTGEGHAVGYAEGLWFDNWTREALPRKEFFEYTKHKSLFFYPSPFMIIPFITGYLTKK